MRHPCENAEETRSSQASDNFSRVVMPGMLRAMLMWLIRDHKGGKIKDSLSADQKCHQLMWGYGRSSEAVALHAAL